MLSFLASDWDSLLSSWVGVLCPKMNSRVRECVLPLHGAPSLGDRVLEAISATSHRILMVERTFNGNRGLSHNTGLI